MLLNEITRIKLGKPDGRLESFMSEWDAITEPHPFNHRARIYGQTTVELAPFGRTIHISDIVSHAPKSGAGSKTLKVLTALADKHKVKLDLNANAYMDSDSGFVSNTYKLVQWYMKHGFRIEDDLLDIEDVEYSDNVEMIYFPK